MEKSNILKIIISLCLLTLAILPMTNKELFVSNSGNISHTNFLFISLVIIGLFKEWKHLKEIVIIIMGIILISLLFWIITGVINNGLLNVKIGYYINLILILPTILSLIKLRQLEKHNSYAEDKR